MKKNQPLLHITWNNLTDIILRERSHVQNYILYKSLYMKFKIRQKSFMVIEDKILFFWRREVTVKGHEGASPENCKCLRS